MSFSPHHPAGIVEYRFPNALWITYEPTSPECWIINVLDLDYKYTVWLATLSLDYRWTLSPRAGPWQARPVLLDEG